MWRSVAFLMSFAVVLEGMTLIAYIVILAAGKQARETGWKLLSLLLVFVAVVHCAAMGLVVCLRKWIHTVLWPTANTCAAVISIRP